MCNASLASVGLLAAGTTFSAAGQIQAGRAAQAQGNYRAAVARNNKVFADRAAEDAEYRGRVAATRKALETRQLIGAQRAALAANGVLVDRDSALDLITDTSAMGTLDLLAIRSNTEREALELRQRGANFGSEARLEELSGRSAKRASVTQSFSTVLGGGAKVADRWYNYRREGVS